MIGKLDSTKKEEPAVANKFQPKKKKASKKKRLQMKKKGKSGSDSAPTPAAPTSSNDVAATTTRSDSQTIALEKSRRDFTVDLVEYLSTWSNRENGMWKFNKTLQIWALEHCFDETKIDASLFKELLPYLASIQGAALERLKTRSEEFIQSVQHSDDIDNNNSDKPEILTEQPINQHSATDAELKRAIRIQAKIGKP